MSFNPTSGDATSSSKGVIQLTGDFGGTASAPTVPSLVDKAPLANPTFTGTVTVPDGSFAVSKVTGLQTTLDDKQPAGDYPTSESVSQQVSAETSGLVTSAELTTSTQYFKRMFVLSSPTEANPAEAQQGDIIFVPTEDLLSTTWTFTGAGLSPATTITTLTAAPNSFGQVSNSPQWDGSDIVIPNAATNANVRPEGLAPASGQWSFGFEFVFGAVSETVTPESGAPWFYAYTPTDTVLMRLTISSSFQIQFRNGAGTLLTSGTSSALTAGTQYFVTVYGTIGTDMVSVRVRKISDGTLFYSNDQAVGSTAALDDVICGRQSGSLEFNTVMKMRRMAYATVAQELYQW